MIKNNDFKKKLVYVGFSFSHHGKYSGYDQILNYINYDLIIDCQRSYNWKMSLKRRTFFNRIINFVIGDRLWWIEIKLILLSVLNKNNLVFHIIYGENIFKYLGYFKFRNEIIITLHQPINYFESHNNEIFLKSLRRVDKIIVMSKEMETYFKNKFPEKIVAYVPHGVDCEFFKPKGIRKQQILMVGNWLRDFKFANDIFEIVLSKCSSLNIAVVTNEHNSLAQFNNRLKIISNISDEELLNLYQTSLCLFLPLHSFTANNALLEAASTGCPIVVASNNIDLSYFGYDLIDYLPKDLDIVSNYLITLVNRSYDLNKGSNLRKYVSENFSWPVIAKKTVKIFLSN